MSGSNFYYDDDELDSYPYFDEDRLRRSPYEERMLGQIARANDPYANTQARGSEDRFRNSHRSRGRGEPPPLLTLREPSDDRRSRAPQGRGIQLDPILRGSESPPPRPRATRRRVDAFEDAFGDLGRPARGSGQNYDYGASGPPRDPFRSRTGSSDHRPYGGGPPPSDPFRLGGNLYNYEAEFGERHPSLEPPDRTGMDEQARRRDQHYRSRIGEPWGIAEMNAYARRRQHEDMMRAENERQRERERERRSSRRHGSAEEECEEDEEDYDD